jgi:hypothetical protein
MAAAVTLGSTNLGIMFVRIFGTLAPSVTAPALTVIEWLSESYVKGEVNRQLLSSPFQSFSILISP